MDNRWCAERSLRDHHDIDPEQDAVLDQDHDGRSELRIDVLVTVDVHVSVLMVCVTKTRVKCSNLLSSFPPSSRVSSLRFDLPKDEVEVALRRALSLKVEQEVEVADACCESSHSFESSQVDP